MSLPLFLGALEQGRQTEFPLRQEDRVKAAYLLDATQAPPGAPLVGIHPGAREMTKRWDPQRFASTAAKIQRGRGGMIVVVGGRNERELAAQILAVLPAGCPVLDLTGRTTLPVLGAVIERMALLLTNDSGPAHIAYALGTPTVTVFGGTDPGRWGPPHDNRFVALTNPVHCWPCPHWVCPTDRECLAGISVDAVVDAAESVMAREPEYGRTVR